MTRILQFFVVAFSRTEASEFRAEVAMKALGEQHAKSVAAHFAGGGEGGVAYSQMFDPLTTERGEIEILARFGEVPDDGTLLRRLSDICSPGRLDIMSAPARPIVRSMPLTHSLKSALSRMMPFAAHLGRSSRKGPRYSLAIAWVVAVLIAAPGSAMLVITAKAAQRETRLVEMVRPACVHSSITNEELHHLIKYEYKVGASKPEVLRTVVTLCQALQEIES